ncbi:DUF3304 domain-containing protein [Caballeronia grimmiae]|uniref:DUF3304 domain-containing protein n=1 Tax=Caballeronia grimmiae TaxID=1071679 RepID=UPI0038B90743
MLLTTLFFCLVAACSRSQSQATETSNHQAQTAPSLAPDYGELESISVQALNYTPWYIHTFSIMGPEGSDISGGGPNVWPAENDSKPSGGGKQTCCLSYPRKWQPDLRLTVRWLADKKMDGKTPGYWYKAENVRIAQYGSQNGGAWMIFLPGDRVRLMITDGNHDGGNNPNNRPADDDPLVVKGVLDDEWNRLYREGGNTQ